MVGRGARSAALSRRREAGMIGGTAVSLNDVEHKVLRARWAEPRVHACIVCASASCPNLRAEARDLVMT